MHAILFAAAIAAAAGPTELRIQNAAARVVVVPARGAAVFATVRQAGGGPPVTLRREGAALVADGGVRGAGNTGLLDVLNQSRCRTDPALLPLITVKVPAYARIDSAGAIFGRIGPADGLALRARGCGTWAVGSVAGPVDVNVAGHLKVALSGHAPHAELRAEGASLIDHTGEVGILTAEVHGSSTIKVRLVDGQVDSVIDGTGDVTYGRPAKGTFCTYC